MNEIYVKSYVFYVPYVVQKNCAVTTRLTPCQYNLMTINDNTTYPAFDARLPAGTDDD